MPEIRSITYFTDVFPNNYQSPINRASTFLSAMKTALERMDIVVQSLRLATQPFPQRLTREGPGSLVESVELIQKHCQDRDISYISIGCVSPDDDPVYVDALGAVFAYVPNTFAAVHIASPQHGIHLPLLRRTAGLIDTVSRITPDGMTNLFFAALANCRPFSPFFPAAYHGGGDPCFALAIQAADLANDAFAGAKDPQEAQNRLTRAINEFSAKIVPIAEAVGLRQGIIFKGLDFSLAPYPVDQKSLGGALEKLGPPFGGFGLVAAASIIMNAIEAADFPSVGFSGLMLPVLEDNILGQRAAEGRLTISDLMLLSAVCGTGLDCVPLAGDIGVDMLYSILLDVAALSLRLDKPLTARLMPFPDKMGGDILEFDFEYFSNSRVLPTGAYSIRHDTPLGGETGHLNIHPRPS